jgi:hypothetical protein
MSLTGEFNQHLQGNRATVTRAFKNLILSNTLAINTTANVTLPLLLNNANASATTTGLSLSILGVEKARLQWIFGTGIQLYDSVHSQPWLYQISGGNNTIRNGNQVFDDGNGNMHLGGSITASTASFTTVNSSVLSTNQAVVTDGSRNLASLAYTSANTASTLVERDVSGNFSAGTITASLTGAASQNLLLTGGTLTGSLTGTSASFPSGVTANITGNLTGTILTAAQTNITSLGTLTSLTVSGNTNLAALSLTNSFNAGYTVTDKVQGYFWSTATGFTSTNFFQVYSSATGGLTFSDIYSSITPLTIAQTTGAATFAAPVTINAGNAAGGNALILNSTSANGTFIDLEVSGTSKASYGWNPSNGIEIYDGVNTAPWLYQASTTLGHIQTHSGNVLDDGNGNVYINSTNGPSAPLVINTNVSNIIAMQLHCAGAGVAEFGWNNSTGVNLLNGSGQIILQQGSAGASDQSLHSLHNTLDSGTGAASFSSTLGVTGMLTASGGITGNLTGSSTLTISSTSTFNGNDGGTFPIRLSNATTSTKELFMGYDGTNDCGFIYAINDSISGKPLVLGQTVKTGTSSSPRNILDDSAGNVTFNSSNSQNVLTLNSPASSAVYCHMLQNGSGKVYYGWDPSVGIQIYDDANGQYWLKQGSLTAGSMVTKNNTLDSGGTTGNMSCKGGLSFGGSDATYGTALTIYDEVTNSVNSDITFTGPITGVTFSCYVNCRRLNNVVHMQIAPGSGTFTGSANIFSTYAGSIPAAFRPSTNQLIPCCVINGGVNTIGYAYIQTTGAISVYAGNGNANFTSGTIGWTYPINATYQI